jgi:hypothetical protein
MAEYRRGTGQQASDADAEVCEAFGIDERTLKDWRTKVRRHLGDLDMKQMLAFANVAGQQTKYYRRHPKLEDAYGAEREAEYGLDALSKAGESYKSKGNKPPRKHVPKSGAK